MIGNLITYKTEDRSDVTKINHYLFGKIVKVKGKKYYYKGILDNIKYAQITKGCYFVTTSTLRSDYFKIYEVDINLNEEDLHTAREIWRTKFLEEGIFVKNL